VKKEVGGMRRGEDDEMENVGIRRK